MQLIQLPVNRILFLGEDLLYLLDEPHTEGNVKCDSGLANYKNYIVMIISIQILNILTIYCFRWVTMETLFGID